MGQLSGVKPPHMDCNIADLPTAFKIFKQYREKKCFCAGKQGNIVAEIFHVMFRKGVKIFDTNLNLY